MTDPQVFLNIIWSSAREYEKIILDDLKSNFKIIKVFAVKWDKERFLDNLKVFYSHSQGHLPPNAYRSLLEGKKRHCGDGEFLVIVFEDPKPDYQLRDTSSGTREVNIRTFEKKAEYRRMTGGGHKIHSSDTSRETNKDLTLLFGLNTEDFLKEYPADPDSVTYISRNCEGVGGYESIERLFYVLNNSIDYCVLRNYECLPDRYTVEGHGDIDLLVENLNFAAYLTLAHRVFPEPWRVYHTIKIAGQPVPFDFRHVGDNYYDRPWEIDILRTKRKEKGLFYVPDAENRFYSLLYHAFVQKKEVKEDYIPRLEEFSSAIGKTFDGTAEAAVSLLDGFMEERGYEYCRPWDWSVVYNKDFLKGSSYAFRFGAFVKRTVETGGNGYVYSVTVYNRGKTFVKRGSPWLLSNEKDCLEKMRGDDHFPEVVSYSEKDGEALLEMTTAPGKELREFFYQVGHQKRSYIKSVVKEAALILEALKSRGVCHRDIQPSNLIVEEAGNKCRVRLVDFGWACEADKLSSAPHPKDLNDPYRPEEGFSDSYSFGKVIASVWPDLPYAKKVVVRLQEGKRLDGAFFTVYDDIRLFIRRHQRVRMLKDGFAKIIKK
ncbi:MAG: serine/threonine protein kinase [Bacteroidales bacterium]|nr:serine/threonine protein kinase [Bacteroidales bacterium]